LHRDLCGSAIDLTEIAGGEFDGNGSEVFVQTVPFRGAPFTGAGLLC
jgi:hypothetical protein